MNIIVKRNRINRESIDGEIFIDGSKICDCAENAIHSLLRGTYQVKVQKCKFRARKMPIIVLDERLWMRDESDSLNPKPSSLNLQCGTCKADCIGLNSTPHEVVDVPGEEGTRGEEIFCPQICPGNGVFNRSDGSILVGKYIAPGCLSHPKDAFDNLYQRIRKNLERGNDISVTIEEHYPLVRRSELTNYEWGCKLLALM